VSETCSPLLEARAVGKCYGGGVSVLTDVSLAVPSGSFVVVTGPSGSGKTTLLAVLGALARPMRGTVLFAGQELNSLSDVGLARVRRRIGFVPQDFALIPGLTVWENISYPLIPRGVRLADRRRSADEVLDRLGLADRRLARARVLSGGEQQRVAIARALVGRPEAVLADEPTSNLDEPSAGVVIGLLDEVRQAGGAVVVSSHDPRILERATAVCELSRGIRVEGRGV